jgi:hypothetical protein
VTPVVTASASGSTSGWRKRLKSTSPLAPARSRRIAISPVELKCGLSLTATGTETASLTCWRISTWRSSTSRARVWGSPGTKYTFSSIAAAPASCIERANPTQPPAVLPLRLAMTGTSTAAADCSSSRRYRVAPPVPALGTFGK